MPRGASKSTGSLRPSLINRRTSKRQKILQGLTSPQATSGDSLDTQGSQGPKTSQGLEGVKKAQSQSMKKSQFQGVKGSSGVKKSRSQGLDPLQGPVDGQRALIALDALLDAIAIMLARHKEKYSQVQWYNDFIDWHSNVQTMLTGYRVLGKLKDMPYLEDSFYCFYFGNALDGPLGREIETLERLRRLILYDEAAHPGPPAPSEICRGTAWHPYQRNWNTAIQNCRPSENMGLPLQLLDKSFLTYSHILSRASKQEPELRSPDQHAQWMDALDCAREDLFPVELDRTEVFLATLKKIFPEGDGAKWDKQYLTANRSCS